MRFRLFRKRRKRRSTVTKHYVTHKEAARQLIHQKLTFWNGYYGHVYNRVAVRNTKRRWGSCSSLGNLNFSYKILFLPETLQDYLIVHELCHLKEFNHGQGFWDLVAQQIPEYKACIAHLREVEKELPKSTLDTSCYTHITLERAPALLG